jgi:biopolymer transport protein ExbD
MHGAGGTGPGGRKRARIEIIPLIDVIFFLLATFVLFTLSLNKSGGLSVLLDEFLARLTQYKLDEGDPRILINADERALFAQVVYVVDQVRIAQIPKIYIETRIFQTNK